MVEKIKVSTMVAIKKNNLMVAIETNL